VKKTSYAMRWARCHFVGENANFTHQKVGEYSDVVFGDESPANCGGCRLRSKRQPDLQRRSDAPVSGWRHNDLLADVSFCAIPLIQIATILNFSQICDMGMYCGMLAQSLTVAPFVVQNLSSSMGNQGQ